jgi:hypothetical protein
MKGTWCATGAGTSEGIAATGRKATSTVMIVGRFAGDRLVEDFRRVRPLQSVPPARRRVSRREPAVHNGASRVDARRDRMAFLGQFYNEACRIGERAPSGATQITQLTVGENACRSRCWRL